MYQLPKLPYPYDAFEPYIDETTMRLHHDKHHAAYVNNANLALEKLVEARRKRDFSAIKLWLLSLSFNLSGHFLHRLFWEIMGPAKTNEIPGSDLKKIIKRDFGSVDNLWHEFSAAAMAVEGAGWSTLVFDRQNQNLIVVPIEKHNLLGIQTTIPILVLDVWEHAYYLKYQSDRQTYVNNFRYLINWKNVEKKYLDLITGKINAE